MRRIYLLYDYEEHGPENLRAFSSFSDFMGFDKSGYCQPDQLRILEERLSKMDGTEPAGNYPLSEGWGGAVLHIVDLEE
jgi:hypothetical protein